MEKQACEMDMINLYLNPIRIENNQNRSIFPLSSFLRNLVRYQIFNCLILSTNLPGFLITISIEVCPDVSRFIFTISWLNKSAFFKLSH